jgi:hypothetical protein
MHKAKFKPVSFNELFHNKKYLPEIEQGIPIGNELLEFMDCLVSTSYSDNKEKRKINHNESEIGNKLLYAVLACRNIGRFKKSWLTIKDLFYFCNGYSEKSIRKGATWLVKKGLFKIRAGSHNKAEFQVNYIEASYQEIVSDILMQRENDVKNEDIVFKGIRYLTTREYKKEGDGKAIGNFTCIPFFLPSAKAKDSKKNLDFDYVRSPFFDLIDGNTLKVILQLAYKMKYNLGIKHTPETRIKIETLMRLCGLSKNKVVQILKDLRKGNFLRSYKTKRNSRSYILNFESYRIAMVIKHLQKRGKAVRKELIDRYSRITVPEQLVKSSFPVVKPTTKTVSPSRGNYNKNLPLNKNSTYFNKNEEVKLERGGRGLKLDLKFLQRIENETDIYKKIGRQLIWDYKNLELMDFPTSLAMHEELKRMQNQNEEILDMNSFIESYNKSQPDESKKFIRKVKELEAQALRIKEINKGISLIIDNIAYRF